MDYYAGADLPDLQLAWYDSSAALINFASGYTFAVKVAPLGSTIATFTKSTGVTGAATTPNVTIAWAVSEIGTLATGTYDVQVQATRTADSKQRFFPDPLRINIKPAIA